MATVPNNAVQRFERKLGRHETLEALTLAWVESQINHGGNHGYVLGVTGHRLLTMSPEPDNVGVIGVRFADIDHWSTRIGWVVARLDYEEKGRSHRLHMDRKDGKEFIPVAQRLFDAYRAR